MECHLPRILPSSLFLLCAGSAYAYSSGPPLRVTAAPGDFGTCVQCHTGTALNGGAGSVRILLPGGPVYQPGVKQHIVVQVADPAQKRWGFEFTARLNSDPSNGQAGDISSTDNFTQVLCDNEAPKPCSPATVCSINWT